VNRSDPMAAQMSSYSFPPELRVDELLARPPVEADIDPIAPVFRDPAIGGEAGMPPWDAETLRMVLHEQLPQMVARGLMCPYVILDAESGQVLGGINLHHFDPLRDAVEVGYWLLLEARGRGVATRSVRAAAEHAFGHGVYRVEAHVRVGNAASERVLDRAGFVREGVKRRYLRRGGETKKHDATLFARLADD
jgi:RimJ/RimL family protein N-acetyltransferase